jgi:hypothetical protein
MPLCYQSVSARPEGMQVNEDFRELIMAISFVSNRVEASIAASLTNSVTEAR